MQWRRHAAAAIIVVLVGAVGCRTTTPPQVTLPPPDQRAPDSTRAPTGLVPAAAISGFVADAASGEPLEGALVVLSAIDRDDQRIALTDDRGYYELIQLPAGTYAVRASSTGYVGRALRQRRLLQGGTPIELMDGERLQQVNFRLRLGGTISGRILDADDRPVALAQAQALRPQFQDGERVLVALGTALSNSRGEFRILSLPPGDYYVSAFDPAAQGAVDESGELQYAPTFYPGVISPADARRVRLEAAGEVSGVELSLQFIAPVRVSGRMVSEDGRPLLSAGVRTPGSSRARDPGPRDTGRRLRIHQRAARPLYHPGAWRHRTRRPITLRVVSGRGRRSRRLQHPDGVGTRRTTIWAARIRLAEHNVTR